MIDYAVVGDVICIFSAFPTYIQQTNKKTLKEFEETIEILKSKDNPNPTLDDTVAYWIISKLQKAERQRTQAFYGIIILLTWYSVFYISLQ